MTQLIYPNPDTVPSGVKNTALKYAYTYIVQELLRLRHNEEGAKFRAGEITEAEFRDFQKYWYEPRSRTVVADLLELRAIAKDYQADFKDKINLGDIPLS